MKVDSEKGTNITASVIQQTDDHKCFKLQNRKRPSSIFIGGSAHNNECHR